MSAIVASPSPVVSTAPSPARVPAANRNPPGFDDFLRLRATTFSRHRLIVFDGRSGSGKSTAIRFLISEHRDFRDRQIRMMKTGQLDLTAEIDVAVIDDLREPRELFAVARLLSHSRTLLVASHIGLTWFRPLQPVVRTAIYRTDTDHAKIRRRLEATGVFATEPVIAAYVHQFGATYTDLDIILERYPDTSFDRSFARFRKYCSMRCHDDRVTSESANVSQ